MKWRNPYGKRIDRAARQENLLGVYRKAFAYFPTEVEGGYSIWLRYYYKVFVREPRSISGCGYISEKRVLNAENP